MVVAMVTPLTKAIRAKMMEIPPKPPKHQDEKPSHPDTIYGIV